MNEATTNLTRAVPLSLRNGSPLKGLLLRCDGERSFGLQVGQGFRETRPRNLPIASPIRLKRAPRPCSRLSIAKSSC